MAETEEEKKKKKKVAKKKKNKKKVTPKQTPKVTSQNKGAKVTEDIKPLEERDWLEKLFGNTEKEDAKAHAANKKRFEAEQRQRELEAKQRRDWLERSRYGATDEGGIMDKSYSSEINKNKGGYVKKYAHGGGVRKTKISDY